ncbi:hypothetical protein VF21_07621 [Pseudogymnoascus sp. 05NY08]|nr:hypothetical protein VF21_07621 [Pseudogymnoascus sp. 05NY08]
MSFSPRHIPALVVCFGVVAGGAMPMFDAAFALSTFGFPKRVASSQPAQAVSIINGARNIAVGIALGTLYLRGMLDAVDVVLGCWGLTGPMDGWVLWQEGVRGKAVFRCVFGTMVGAYGWLGMTAGRG